jgi:hypothetical protein
MTAAHWRRHFWLLNTSRCKIVEALEGVRYDRLMTEEKPRYKWPRYVLAAVIVFFVAAIVWVVIEARKVEHERDFSAPVQTK